MFSKQTKKEVKIETVIGSGTEVEGNFQTTEGLRIDGKIKGSVRAESVIVGLQGTVIGDVTGNKVTISGKVEGNVYAGTIVELLTEGQISGDISTSKLVISDGARFEGHCHMIKSDGQIIELHPGSDANKNLKVVGQNNKIKAPVVS